MPPKVGGAPPPEGQARVMGDAVRRREQLTGPARAADFLGEDVLGHEDPLPAQVERLPAAAAVLRDLVDRHVRRPSRRGCSSAASATSSRHDAGSSQSAMPAFAPSVSSAGWDRCRPCRSRPGAPSAARGAPRGGARRPRKGRRRRSPEGAPVLATRRPTCGHPGPPNGEGQLTVVSGCQTPTGCQTVLVSRNAGHPLEVGLGAPVGLGAGRAEHPLEVLGGRLLEVGQLGVAGDAGEVDRVDVHVRGQPGAISASRPVRMLTTPPGTSEVASTSARVTAGSGRSLDEHDDRGVARDDHRRDDRTRPSRRTPAAPRTATTPVGSGVEMLKYGPATGLALPMTWVILSAHPAYQTSRSMRGVDDLRPARRSGPRPARPPRRTAPAGPPSSRRPGRGSARGCTPSAGPAAERLARRRDGVAGVLARGQRGVGQEPPLASSTS